MGKDSVPLVIYGRDGARQVVGEAELDFNPISQEMRVVGKLNGETEQLVLGMFSLGFDDETD